MGVFAGSFDSMLNHWKTGTQKEAVLERGEDKMSWVRYHIGVIVMEQDRMQKEGFH